MRLLRRLLLALLLAFLASLALGRFLPVSSTLMIGRWVTFQPVERHWVPLSSISPTLKFPSIVAGKSVP